MTRRVNFEAQQRVDRPDVQAMQTFLLQDFRRVVRQVVMGDDAPNDNGRVLTGFKVEPENAGVSPRVVIKLDLSGGVVIESSSIVALCFRLSIMRVSSCSKKSGRSRC